MEIEGLAKPDVRMLAGAAQGGVNKHISQTMQPERPSLAGCLMVSDVLETPTASKIDGKSANLRVLTPVSEHGLVSIMGPEGNAYSNAVGTSGVVSSGRNWGRLASAAHR